MKAADQRTFFLNFLKKPLQNASIVPSSKRAARAMLHGLDLSQSDYVVELGPGTGVFTEALYRQLPENAKVMVVELESSYITSLKRRFGDRFEIVEASAASLDELVRERGWPRVDLIVSGLPFTMPKEVKRPLWASLEGLASVGTTIRWFTYFPWLMRWYYREFQVKKVRFVARNFPPLWVFTIN